MRHDDEEDDPFDGDRPEPGDDDAGTDPGMQTEAEVTCPYCGEVVQITLDPDSGSAQEYVEDCEVCCRPWNVQVNYDETGRAEVIVEQG